jgi:ribose transport system permease protein
MSNDPQSTDSPGAAASSGNEPDKASGSTALLVLALRLVQLGPMIVLIVLVAVMSGLSDVFFTERNLLNVGIQATPIALLAIGQFLVILTGGVDVSVGATAALSSVIGALLFVHGDASQVVVALAVLGVGLAVGLVNGLVYVVFKVPHPFIVTLGTYNIVSGVAYLLAHGQAVIGAPTFVDTLANGELAGIPNPIILFVGVLSVFLAFLYLTKLGRWIYAVGGNADAARRAGIPVGMVLVIVYGLCGLTAGIAGLVLLGRTNSGDPSYSNSLAELQSIAAVVIGGTSFLGGRGYLATITIGALALAVIANGLNLLNVNGFYQLVVTGTVLILATIFDVARGRIEGRLRVAAGARS